MNFLGIPVIIVFYLVNEAKALFTTEEEIQIRDLVESVLDCREIPGLAISVVKGNETWARGYGLADIERGIPVQNKTKFVIGSLGKAFTMTLLGHVLQEKGLNWDSKLSDIPNGKYEFADENRTRETALADLLSHRTGLSSVADYGFIGGYPETTTKQTMVNRLKYVPSLNKLRESFIYNNLMYMALGHVTETLTDALWEDLMTQDILEPIGMEDSSILMKDDEVYEEDFAKPHILIDDQIQLGTRGLYKITPLEPAGSIISTAEDMAKWMRFNLNNATTEKHVSILHPDLFSEAFEEQMPLSVFAAATYSIKKPKYPVDDVTSGYGYAWFTSKYRGFKKVWHSGGLFSYVSLIWLYPDQGIGLFASTNGPGLPSNAGTALNTIFYYLSDLLLGFEPWLTVETACSYPYPWLNKSTLDFPMPERYFNNNTVKYTGIYGSHLLPDVTISGRLNTKSARGTGVGNSGLLRFLMNRIQGDLYPTEEIDTFHFQMTDPWEYAIERKLSENFTLRYPVVFEKSKRGDVIGFNVTFGVNTVIPFRKNMRFMPSSSAPKFPNNKQFLISLIALIFIY